MIDRKALPDLSEPPEDVASLYSWANLHGAKYRDFSAARAQSREKARQRVETVAAEESRNTQEEAAARQKAVEMQRAFEAAQAAEAARQAAYEAGQRAAQQKAAEESAQRAAIEEAAQRAARQAVQEQAAQHVYPAYAPPAMQAPGAMPPQAPPAYGIPQSYPAPAPVYAQAAPPPQEPVYAPYQPPAPVFSATGAPSAAEESLRVRNRWAPPESQEIPGRPAWLTSEPTVSEPSSAQPIPQAPEGTLQDSRDRVTSRWFALQGIFDGTAVPASPQEAHPAQLPARAPVLAVFSLAGGVGKTTVVASLGRALAAKGERVLLVDTASYGLLPFHFGARDQRVGTLRTFSPPGGSVEAPVQMVSYEPDTMGPENLPQEVLSSEVQRLSQGTHRVIVDLSTASGATTRRVLRLAPTVLVPLLPDMNSVVSIASIDSFFQHNFGPSGKQLLPYYILNQFDPAQPLHLDVREVMREQVGDRLLPFAIHRSAAISEALAEGMTVIDYAPNSTVSEEFGSLANWLKSLAAPATQGFRGVRWSER